VPVHNRCDIAFVARFSAVFALAVVLSSCGLQQDLGAAAATSGVVPPSPAPALSGTTLDGKPIDIATWRGHVRVIDWWGSWCGPCRKEQPELDRLDLQFAPRGVEFLGVDILDNRASALAYVDDFKVPYPSIFDPDSLTEGPWLVVAPPTIIVVDASGTIRGRFFGTLTGLQSLIQSLLDGKSA
jgi:thiol-disulfide isomerase/thioredoxin